MLKKLKQIKEREIQIRDNKLEKLIKKHKINKTDAEVLTKNLQVVELFEKVAKKINSKLALPWITTELLSVLNYNKKTLDQVNIKSEHVIELLELLEQKKITPLKAQEILRKFIPKSFSPKKEKISIITNDKKLLKIIQKIIKNNKNAVKDYKKGEQKALNFLIGKVMQTTNKSADYQIVRKILEKELT